MFKIIVDSSCDMKTLKDIAPNVKYEIVPLKIIVGEEEYVDNDDLDIDVMCMALSKYNGKTSTACPSPSDYEKTFEDADEIFVITITSELSGSYNAAQIARKMHLENNPNKKITIIDSLSTSGAMALVAQKINDLIKKGLDFDSISSQILDYSKNNVNLTFVLHSLDNLVKNGRVSKLVGSAVNVLGIKIIGRASDEGTLQPIHKARGKDKVVTLLLQEMETKGFNGKKAVMAHCGNLNGAEQLKNKILEKYPNAEIEVFDAAGLVTYYAEPKAVLIGYECE